MKISYIDKSYDDLIKREVILDEIEHCVNVGISNLLGVLERFVDDKLNLYRFQDSLRNVYLEFIFLVAPNLSEEEIFDCLVNDLSEYIIKSFALQEYCVCIIKDTLKNIYDNVMSKINL